MAETVSTARKYRKRRGVEAVQWDGDARTAQDFIGGAQFKRWQFCHTGDSIMIRTAKGNHRCTVGYWIVKDGDEFYSAPSHIFEENDEAVDE